MHEIRELTIDKLTDSRFEATVRTLAGDVIAIAGEYTTVGGVSRYECADRYREETDRLDRLPVQPLYWLLEKRIEEIRESQQTATTA